MIQAVFPAHPQQSPRILQLATAGDGPPCRRDRVRGRKRNSVDCWGLERAQNRYTTFRVYLIEIHGLTDRTRQFFTKTPFDCLGCLENVYLDWKLKMLWMTFFWVWDCMRRTNCTWRRRAGVFRDFAARLAYDGAKPSFPGGGWASASNVFPHLSCDQITSGQRESGRPAEVPGAKRKAREKAQTPRNSGAKRAERALKARKHGDKWEWTASAWLTGSAKGSKPQALFDRLSARREPTTMRSRSEFATPCGRKRRPPRRPDIESQGTVGVNSPHLSMIQDVATRIPSVRQWIEFVSREAVVRWKLISSKKCERCWEGKQVFVTDSGSIEATPRQIFRCLLVSKVQKIHCLGFLILLHTFTKFDQVPGFINLPDFETAGSARPGNEACKGHGQEERLACSQGRVWRGSQRGTFFLFIDLWEHAMSSKEV